MERKINHLSICYTLFLILLFLSGSLEGVWSEAVYFLAFLVPMAFGLWTVKDDENDKSYLGVRGEDLKFFIPLDIHTKARYTIITKYFGGNFVMAVDKKTVNKGDKKANPVGAWFKKAGS